jgi:cysteine synthase
VRPDTYFLNDVTDPDLPAGPATIGLEILEQLPGVAAIYVPMGDTALIRGIGAAVKQLRPSVKLVGVQAAGSGRNERSFRLSLWRAASRGPNGARRLYCSGVLCRACRVCGYKSRVVKVPSAAR